MPERPGLDASETRQENLNGYPERMLGLADLPVCDSLAFSQVRQERFDIIPGPLLQRFPRQEIGKIPRPVNIERRTVGANPVFLGTGTVGFPKTITSLGFSDIHAHYPRKPLDVKRLPEAEALYNR